jgi:hypothetical protein
MRWLVCRHSVVAVLLFCTACVVPVGPEWSDPEGNSPPTIESAVPAIGSVLDLMPDAGSPLGVRVVVSDANTSDQIYMRWIIDYPPYQEAQTHIAWEIILPQSEQAERAPVEFAPNCSDDHIARGIAAHRLLLVVTDRPFVDRGQAEPDAVQDGGFRVEASWAFDLDCP